MRGAQRSWRRFPSGALTNASSAWLTVRAFFSLSLADCVSAAEAYFERQHRSSRGAAAVRGVVFSIPDFQDGCAHSQSLRLGRRVRAGAGVLPHAVYEDTG